MQRRAALFWTVGLVVISLAAPSAAHADTPGDETSSPLPTGDRPFIPDGLQVEDARSNDELSALFAQIATTTLASPDIYGFRVEGEGQGVLRIVTSPGTADTSTRLVSALLAEYAVLDMAVVAVEGPMSKSDLAKSFDALDVDFERNDVHADVGWGQSTGTILVLTDPDDKISVQRAGERVSALGLQNAVTLKSVNLDLTYSAGGGESTGGCTAGFAVRDAFGPAILTAGHCGETPVTLHDTSQGGYNPVPLEASIHDGYHGTVGGAYHLDRQIHRVLPPHVVDPAIRYNSANDRMAVVGALVAYGGQSICQFGKTSGQLRCGTVTEVLASTATRNIGGVSVRGLAFSDLDVATGDSGGPVFELASRRAVGIITGGSGGATVIGGESYYPDTTFTLVGRALESTGGFGLLPQSGQGRYTPITPFRRFDSRTTSAFGAGTVRNYSMLGQPGIPAADVQAVVVNVGTLDSAAAGFVQLYPRGDVVPASASLNFAPGLAVSEFAVVPLGTSGQISVRTSQPTHVLLDVVGYVSDTGNGFTFLSPSRAYDSRTANNPIPANSNRDVTLTGVPNSAAGALVNVTVLAPSSSTWLVAHAPTSARPPVSFLTASAGQTVANMMIVPVTASGSGFPTMRIYNRFGNAHVVVDVLGYYNTTSQQRFVPTPPTRLIDSRIDLGTAGGPLGAGSQRTVTLVGLDHAPIVPGGATGVILRVTAVGSTAPSHIRVTPTGASGTSTLNHQPGTVVGNSVAVSLSTSAIRIYNAFGSVHFVIDLEGYTYDPA